MTLTQPLPRENRGRDTQLLTAQLELLAGVVAGHPLTQALEALLRVVERVSPGGLIASVLLTDESGRHLLHGAAPSLPPEYNAAIDGIAVGPEVGSCGTAAYRRTQVIVEDIATDPLWSEFKDLAMAAGLRACWSTPIGGVGGRVLGTFAMYYPEPRRPEPGDLALIDVLVRTVAMAIDRSRQDQLRERELAEERAVGLTFQRSMLPDVPARLGPLTLATRYRTGDPGVHVGGDWFDAMAVEDGIMLVVGDVQGHDVGAAALMAQLRTVVRASAYEGHPPSAVLARAADYLERLESDLIVTVLVAYLDVEARLVTVASAGHLPPLVLETGSAGMTVSSVAVETGPPLGAGDHWVERSSHLEPEAVLLLFTDGLVETRTWDIDEGIDRLRLLLGSLPSSAGPALVLDTALELLPAGSRGDDVAVLAAQTPARRRAPLARVERSLPSQPMSAPLARSWAEGWLARRKLPASTTQMVALVVSELVTNAVRQGDGQIRVTLGEQEHTLLVEVFDSGHRMPVLAESSPESTSGRGLHLVEAVSEAWGVREDLQGKTVWARISPS
jgi:serine phosphatase RsbU (regulator of sigma subunit)/anti-sigma regulatory factor (Ser/Thr protein kinase)